MNARLRIYRLFWRQKKITKNFYKKKDIVIKDDVLKN